MAGHAPPILSDGICKCSSSRTTVVFVRIALTQSRRFGQPIARDRATFLRCDETDYL
jgi:hypothetical protein